MCALAPRRPADDSTPDSSTPRRDTTRGLAPVVGVALLVALTVVLAALAAGAVFAVDADPDDPSPRASLSLSVDGDRLVFVHRGGDSLDVRRLRLAVAVDGDPLAHQPPVPFFSARGFRAGPTGPFNRASDPHWTAGETATLQVAGTNRPALAAGGVVTVRVFSGDAMVATLSARRSS